MRLSFLIFNVIFHWVFADFAKAQEFASEWVTAARVSIEIDQLNSRLRGAALDQNEKTELSSQIQQKNRELRTQLLKLHDQKIPLYEKPLTRRELQERIVQARSEMARLNGNEKKLKPSERESKYERLAELTQVIEADLKSLKTAPTNRSRSMASETTSSLDPTVNPAQNKRQESLKDLPVLFETEPTGAR